MYFNLISQMIIDKPDGTRLIFGGLGQPGCIESITIEQSVNEMGDTCTVVIPRNFNPFRGKVLLNYLAEDDRVSIHFGYGQLNLEFSGYLSQISGTAPIEMKLADEFHPLRKNSHIKSYPAVKLKQLLQDIAPGYKIECPDVNMGKFVIDRASSYQVLKDIQDNYGLTSFIKDGTLYCQFAYDVRNLAKSRHVYYLCDQVKNGQRIRMGNVREGGNNLKFERKEAKNFRVEIVTVLPNGKKRKVSVGSKADGASVRKIQFHGDRPESELKEIATKMFQEAVYDGYTGTITGFGLPLTRPADALELIDFEYPERNGTNLIEKVTVKYSENGIERENTISYKI